MHCWVFFQDPILKIWLQVVVKAGAINFDALHQLLYLDYLDFKWIRTFYPPMFFWGASLALKKMCNEIASLSMKQFGTIWINSWQISLHNVYLNQKSQQCFYKCYFIFRYIFRHQQNAILFLRFLKHYLFYKLMCVKKIKQNIYQLIYGQHVLIRQVCVNAEEKTRSLFQLIINLHRFTWFRGEPPANRRC